MSDTLRIFESCAETESWDRSLRLTLMRGEALRLPRNARRLRVLSGKAWVSMRGEDIVLDDCQSLHLAARRQDGPVVSAAGDQALLIELDRGAGGRIAL